MGPRRTAMLLLLAAGQACAQPLPAPLAPPPEPKVANPAGSGKPIFAPPPLQWDAAMLSYRPASQQTATDFANLTNGLAFGMSPGQLNARLPDPSPAMSWNALTLANEFPGEVRALAVPIGQAGPLRMDLTACVGAMSQIVFLFTSRGLVRLSYRLAADRTCTDTSSAAQQIFARYVAIGPEIAASARYHTGKTEVVDITDALAGSLTPVRWRQIGN